MLWQEVSLFDSSRPFLTALSCLPSRFRGNKIGKAEYLTPQSESVMGDSMMGGVMQINLPAAMQVRQRDARKRGSGGMRGSGAGFAPSLSR